MAGNSNSGRRKGSKNVRRFAQRLAKEYKLEPLDFMLIAMNDEKKDYSERMDAAFKAAPYIHPKLSNVEMKHEGGIEIKKIERKIVKADDTNR